MVKPTSKSSFDLILDEIKDLHARKSADYARESDKYRNFRMNTQIWGTTDWQEPLKRGTEKMIRIAELTSNSKTPKNESIRDSIIDIAVLSIIALDMFDQKK